jgi:N-methylhydantoinase A
VTDANLVLGYLPADRALAGEVRLHARLAEEAVARLGRSLGLEPMRCAEGIIQVANAEMVRALRVVTVERGIDPRRYALLAFGGAGPLHAPAIADELQIDHILCPQASGVLAALGLVVSPRRRDAQRTVLLSEAELTRDRIAAVVDDLAARSRAALDAEEAAISVNYELRYRGQSFELPVSAPPHPDPHELRAGFAAVHEDRYGYCDPDQDVELVTVRVTATLPGASLELAAGDEANGPGGDDPSSGSARRASRPALIAGKRLELETIRVLPPAGNTIAAPAVVELPETTVLVPPGWRAKVDATATIHLRRE